MMGFVCDWGDRMDFHAQLSLDLGDIFCSPHYFKEDFHFFGSEVAHENREEDDRVRPALPRQTLAKISWYLRRELCCLSHYCKNLVNNDSHDIIYDVSPSEVKLFSAALAEHLVGLCYRTDSENYRESRWFVYESLDARYFCHLIGIDYGYYVQLANVLECYAENYFEEKRRNKKSK